MPTITLQAPRSGISISPHVGYDAVVNIDIHSSPGVAMINNILTKVSGSTVDAQINWLVRDPDTSANVFALDSAGTLYKSADSGATWSEPTGSVRGGVGQGLAVKWGYVFVFCDTTVDVMKISDSSWTDNWITIGTDSLWHPAFFSKNADKFYFGCGRYLGSISQVSGQTFDPANSATYAVTLGTAADNALDLSSSYRIKCIREVGQKLAIGTWQGTAVTDIRIADIFTWDYSSATYGNICSIDDYGVHAMEYDGSSLIVLAGVSGTIRKFDGTNAYVIGQIPTSICDTSGTKYIEFYPGSIIQYKNKTFFGIGNNALGLAGIGIWSLQQTGRGNILCLEHQISNFATTGNDGTTQISKVSALLSITRNTLLAGWRDNTTYGIDLTTSTSYTTSYGAYFISPLYTVGSNQQPFKFTRAEFQLARPLRTNEGIKLEYRVDLTASFATIRTIAYSDIDVGGVVSKSITTEIPNDIKACEQIQFKISFTGTTTSLEFKTVIFS